jgi:ribosomal protein S18 acetylase RimI-like enzyme
MAVAPEARGRGYGDLLMDAVIAFARETGVDSVIIVSNTRLAPAIRLYEKHGFQREPFERDARYERADVKLRLVCKP